MKGGRAPGGPENGNRRQEAPEPYLTGTNPKSLGQTTKKELRIFEDKKLENIFCSLNDNPSQAESLSKPTTINYSKEEIKKLIDSPPSQRRPLAKGRFHMRIDMGKVHGTQTNR